MFGCGVRLPTSHGGMGSVVVLLLRARARFKFDSSKVRSIVALLLARPALGLRAIR